jgi:hypothetical protein
LDPQKTQKTQNGLSCQERGEELCGVYGFDAREVVHLVAAGDAACDHDLASRERAGGGQDAPFGNGA